jgi:hypothetical protein
MRRLIDHFSLLVLPTLKNRSKTIGKNKKIKGGELKSIVLDIWWS